MRCYWLLFKDPIESRHRNHGFPYPLLFYFNLQLYFKIEICHEINPSFVCPCLRSFGPTKTKITLVILNLITRGKLSLILSDYYYYLFRSEASEDDIQSTKELQNTESLGTKVVDILTKTLGENLHPFYLKKILYEFFSDNV